jgi:DNA replicative helicase MCM subunit Mcm2 (Cdc46/Mcm family)
MDPFFLISLQSVLYLGGKSTLFYPLLLLFFYPCSEAERAAVHEAMEQCTVSVAKAGMVATLPSRTSVVGSCNARGHRRYDPRIPLAEQIAISGPLLSRSDPPLWCC